MIRFGANSPSKINSPGPPGDNKNSGLTISEQSIMNDLISAWNKFIELKKQHPSDIKEFQESIHRLQGILSLRVIRRQYPKYWYTEER